MINVYARKAILAMVSLTIAFSSLAQKPESQSSNPALPPMSSYDSLKLSQLPEFRLSDNTLRRALPYAIDNSAHPWFRPLIAQVGLECGQASSIGVVFTYEMNYLRNVPGNQPQNQYATHFAYNFINGGADQGVSFFETFEILKQAGNPTVADYGGMAYGGAARWMSGYDLYYNAMHNRVTEVYSIRVNTVEGLQTLKNWIYDHGNGSTAGGLGCFYAEFTHPPSVLPEGTPEAGKHVIYAWGNSSNHAMSIVGYNDSIRWDYNNDGLYTNDIDINADGVVDMKDWEIGGFKMANTYGSISGWGDQGFSYMMYKSVADQFQQGGIWNNTVVVVDVRNHEPQLTAKVTLTYPCRDKVRVMAGVSTDPGATEPEHILHYPVFDFQGGCNPMQGTTGYETIEFGLDLNLLLQYVEPGQDARYFLLVQEDDPLGSIQGALGSFAIIDYTNGAQVHNSTANELPLSNNEVTMAWVNVAADFDQVNIVTDTIMPVPLYTSFSVPLEADSGTSPYHWSFVNEYARFDTVGTMQEINALKLQPSSNSNGKALVELPFEFPFYGQTYHEVYATVDGYLMFENSLLPWPYYIEGRIYFIQTPMIAPVMSNPLLASGSAEGIWYEESADYVTFRWRLSSNGASGSTFNATARLYPDGKIEINYGEFNLPSYVERYAGISAGDGLNYHILTYDQNFSPQTDQLNRYTPINQYPGIQLSPEGVLSGQSNELLQNLPVRVSATDQNNLKDYRTFYINTNGLLMNYSLEAGSDSIVAYGETVSMTLHITNLNSFAVGSLNFSINSFDPYFSLTQTQASYPGLQPGESVSIPGAFQFIASEEVPDSHVAAFILNAVSAEGSWSRSLAIKAYRPAVEIASMQIVDGNNGILEPGETVLLNLSLLNAGGVPLTNPQAAISSWDPYLTIYSGPSTTDTLQPDELWPIVFSVKLAQETPLYHVVEINLSVTGDHNYSYLKTIPIIAGLLAETFENGSFSGFDWVTGGDAPWFTEEGSAHEGDWCARSGLIYDNQTSNLLLTWDVAYADSVSFWFKVSSEANYDYLHFYSNSEELGKWAGEWNWTRAAFNIPAGEQTFAWHYLKDYSVSNGEDCARVDYIILPAYAVATATGEKQQTENRLNVFPNPGNGDLFIEYSLAETSPVQIILFDQQGRTIFFRENNLHQAGTYKIKPDIQHLKAGSYTLMLRTNQGILVKKIIRTGN